ncbi:MAG: hypothetical protein PHP01_03135 [Phycisphaerae bacterium]|nr:hypothetical protein [Phycisphaerae bacterium]
MQLKVVKADGTQEEYLHTKVIASFVNALAEPGRDSIALACELAETVTFYLYNRPASNSITSNEIFSMILAALLSTGYGCAAENLAAHHQRRNLLRARVEVIKFDAKKYPANSMPQQFENPDLADGWNKSKIIKDLRAEYKLDAASARMIASMVEEKILNSSLCSLTADFVKFLVISQTQAVLSAQQQLKSPISDKKTYTVSDEYNNPTDGLLRQSQKGLCPVEV